MSNSVEMVLTGRVDFLVQKGYDKELVEQIRRKMLQIHRFLEAARSSKAKCENLEVAIQLPDGMAADSFVVTDCREIVDSFIKVLKVYILWYDKVKHNEYKAADFRVVTFNVSYWKLS